VVSGGSKESRDDLRAADISAGAEQSARSCASRRSASSLAACSDVLSSQKSGSSAFPWAPRCTCNDSSAPANGDATYMNSPSTYPYIRLRSEGRQVTNMHSDATVSPMQTHTLRCVPCDPVGNPQLHVKLEQIIVRLCHPAHERHPVHSAVASRNQTGAGPVQRSAPENLELA
jgi:hypothetical protein